MKIILQDKNKYILRIMAGEDVIAGIAGFCADNKIEAGSFSGIGAASDFTLSYYDLNKKEYKDVSIFERHEIASLNGNISRMEDEVIVHAHGCLSDSEMRPKCGHVKKLVVSVTCEVFFEALSGKMTRSHDKDIGLNLLN